MDGAEVVDLSMWCTPVIVWFVCSVIALRTLVSAKSLRCKEITFIYDMYKDICVSVPRMILRLKKLQSFFETAQESFTSCYVVYFKWRHKKVESKFSTVPTLIMLFFLLIKVKVLRFSLDAEQK